MTSSERLDMGPELAAANLMSGATLVATVGVPPFPDNPQLVRFEDRYFGSPIVGYGVAIVYVEAPPPYDAQELDPRKER